MKWRVYLSDGSTFSDEDGNPWDVPLSGVVAIAQADDVVGRTVTVGFNYYYFRDDEWWGCYDSTAMLIELTSDMTGKINCVRAGRTVSNKIFSDVRKRARHDEGFPVKTGNSKQSREYPEHAIRYRNDE